MSNRPFEEHRFVGDKRSMVFHDVSHEVETCALDDVVEAVAVALFGPDESSEARNRGYIAHADCDEEALSAAEA